MGGLPPSCAATSATGGRRGLAGEIPISLSISTSLACQVKYAAKSRGINRVINEQYYFIRQSEPIKAPSCWISTPSITRGPNGPSLPFIVSAFIPLFGYGWQAMTPIPRPTFATSSTQAHQQAQERRGKLT